MGADVGFPYFLNTFQMMAVVGFPYFPNTFQMVAAVGFPYFLNTLHWWQYSGIWIFQLV